MVELIAKRYGSAIFELAKEQGAVLELQKEILSVRKSFEDGEIIEFLNHPKVSTEEKIELIETSLKDTIGHDLMGLLVLVLQKGRQSHIGKILDATLALIDEYMGKVKAYITSAEPLTEQQGQGIKEHLAKLTGKDIIPVYSVDTAIIGGLVIRIGDRIVDNSVKGHMHTMSRILLESHKKKS